MEGGMGEGWHIQLCPLICLSLLCLMLTWRMIDGPAASSRQPDAKYEISLLGVGVCQSCCYSFIIYFGWRHKLRLSRENWQAKYLHVK